MNAHLLSTTRGGAPSRLPIPLLQPPVLFTRRHGVCFIFRRVPDSQILASRELLADGQSILDFTFDLAEMRAIAFDRKTAQKLLGHDLAEAFHSLVADMRNAMYLDELVDSPAAVRSDPIILEYRLGSDCILEVQPIGVRAVDMTNWAIVHRLKLVRIVQNGTQII